MTITPSNRKSIIPFLSHGSGLNILRYLLFIQVFLSCKLVITNCTLALHSQIIRFYFKSLLSLSHNNFLTLRIILGVNFLLSFFDFLNLFIDTGNHSIEILNKLMFFRVIQYRGKSLIAILRYLFQ